jgi:hypothetical protein
VADRAGHHCEYCRAPEVLFNFPHEVEHIVPESLGGPNELTNLALACRACNLYKGQKQAARDPATEREERLYNPRTDVWDEHFEFDIGSAMIHGRTGIGRATIAALRLNSGLQIPARRNWMFTNLFPPDL